MIFIEPIGRAEVELRVGNLKNGKAAGKDVITGEIIKGGGDRVVDWRLCNMAFESSIMHENWRSVMNLLLYKGKGEKIESKNCRGINLSSLVGKAYAGILVDRICSDLGFD